MLVLIAQASLTETCVYFTKEVWPSAKRGLLKMAPEPNKLPITLWHCDVHFAWPLSTPVYRIKLRSICPWIEPLRIQMSTNYDRRLDSVMTTMTNLSSVSGHLPNGASTPFSSVTNPPNGEMILPEAGEIVLAESQADPQVLSLRTGASLLLPWGRL